MNAEDQPRDAHDPEPGAGPPATGRPRPRWLRGILVALVIAVAVIVLFLWVFPWVEGLQQDPTIGAHVLRAPR